MQHWSMVIGLEIHVQLKTASKMFSRAATQYGALPNTQCGNVDLGLPGSLPQPNRHAMALGITFGLVTDAHIPPFMRFDRKNYFYADLPKGYQITQNTYPVVIGGKIDILDSNNAPKTIRIHHAHLEEDAGKSLHHDDASYVDLNRAGVPLLEIVSEPDMRSSHEAIEYLKKIHQLVRYFDISDANMQEGSFRVDINISIRESEDAPFGTRVEVKNVNSFRFIEKAIEYEFERQKNCIEQGIPIVQETRKFIESTNTTESMRSKENADDYRYFKEPDIPDIILSESFVEGIRERLGETPAQARHRLQTLHQLSYYDADVITQEKSTLDYFDGILRQDLPAKLTANWLMGPVMSVLNKHNLDFNTIPMSSTHMAELIHCMHTEIISNTQAKEVLEILWAEPNLRPLDVIDARNMRQITDHDTINTWIQKVLADYPQQLAQYHNGQHKLLGFFVGQLMKASEGKVHPGHAQKLMQQALDS